MALSDYITWGTPFNDKADVAPSTIYAGLSGADYITTNGGINFIYGGYNNDTIVVNSGYNRVFGGADNDNFVIESTPGPNVGFTRIGDFREEGDDLIYTGEDGAGNARDVNYREFDGNLLLNIDGHRVFMTNKTWEEVEEYIVYGAGPEEPEDMGSAAGFEGFGFGFFS